MPANLMIVWDYDSALGQVNATYPYKFDEQKLFQEISNVDAILKLASEYDLKMTFACLGFAAEPGVYPYHIPEQIRAIYQSGHEVASHSWRHEWFPFLEAEQIIRSLERSKYALETCLRQAGSVLGFVLPFSRPMSWYARGSFSLGDRAWGLWYPGADLGQLIRMAEKTGYRWFRVSYRTLLQRLRRQHHPALDRKWDVTNKMICVPQHFTGFDEQGRALLAEAVRTESALVVVGHPSGLSRTREENIEHLKIFLRSVANYRDGGQLVVQSVGQYLEFGNTFHE